MEVFCNMAHLGYLLKVAMLLNKVTNIQSLVSQVIASVTIHPPNINRGQVLQLQSKKAIHSILQPPSKASIQTPPIGIRHPTRIALDLHHSPLSLFRAISLQIRQHQISNHYMVIVFFIKINNSLTTTKEESYKQMVITLCVIFVCRFLL